MPCELLSLDLEYKQRVATALILRLRAICGCLNEHQFCGGKEKFLTSSISSSIEKESKA